MTPKQEKCLCGGTGFSWWSHGPARKLEKALRSWVLNTARAGIHFRNPGQRGINPRQAFSSLPVAESPGRSLLPTGFTEQQVLRNKKQSKKKKRYLKSINLSPRVVVLGSGCVTVKHYCLTGHRGRDSRDDSRCSPMALPKCHSILQLPGRHALSGPVCCLVLICLRTASGFMTPEKHLMIPTEVSQD